MEGWFNGKINYKKQKRGFHVQSGLLGRASQILQRVLEIMGDMCMKRNLSTTSLMASYSVVVVQTSYQTEIYTQGNRPKKDVQVSKGLFLPANFDHQPGISRRTIRVLCGEGCGSVMVLQIHSSQDAKSIKQYVRAIQETYEICSKHVMFIKFHFQIYTYICIVDEYLKSQ